MLAIRAGANSAASVALCCERDPELEEVALKLAHQHNIDLHIIARQVLKRAATFRLRPTSNTPFSAGLLGTEQWSAEVRTPACCAHHAAH